MWTCTLELHCKAGLTPLLISFLKPKLGVDSKGMSIIKQALTFLFYFVTFLALAQKLHFTLVKKTACVFPGLGKRVFCFLFFPEMAALLSIGRVWFCSSALFRYMKPLGFIHSLPRLPFARALAQSSWTLPCSGFSIHLWQVHCL